MIPMTELTIQTGTGDKTIGVYHADIAALDEPVDVMTVSAFYNSYTPTPRTVHAALDRCGISTLELSFEPEIDLRDHGNIWLSRAVTDGGLPIGRIGCVEMSPFNKDRDGWKQTQDQMLRALSAYFRMLEIAALSGIPVGTVAMPLLGAGSQGIDTHLVLYPMITECIGFLKRCQQAQRIMFIEYHPRKAYLIAKTLEQSYAVRGEQGLGDFSLPGFRLPPGPLAFISHSSKDQALTERLAGMLETEGVTAWFTPRDVQTSDFAGEIVTAIRHSREFVLILSEHSLRSEHVLNEIAVAFKGGGTNPCFRILRIDETELPPSFEYYLERQHRIEVHDSSRLEEGLQSLLSQTVGVNAAPHKDKGESP